MIFFQNTIRERGFFTTFVIMLGMIMLYSSCGEGNKRIANKSTKEAAPFTWDNANIYFLLTDRFNNGDKNNDFVVPTGSTAAPYRGFMGGDIKGVTDKIKEGYFDSLGITAIWTTPVYENIKGSVDEGTGLSFGFHGYWTRDWTAFDPRVTSEADFAAYVKEAHAHGIRVVMDVIINHTGPVTPMDTQWPDEWVRTTPRCVYKDFLSTVTCTLVDNLPDIKTESTQEVFLPSFLVEKWKKEGRLEKEQAELEAFFKRTGYPKRPYYYIIKWLTDYVRKYGIDGFRVDTAKHTEAGIWAELLAEAMIALDDWKKTHPDDKLDDTEFYMVGEVYNYFISGGRPYDYGDQKVDFFANGFKSLINFDFKSDANNDYPQIFAKYDSLLHGPLKGKTVLNYISSHDDGGPFDKERKRTFESATKLMLTQGGAQVYYGDEISRSLSVNAQGDATLRSFMNWEDLENKPETQALYQHWCKLGQFRKYHPAIGAGRHSNLTDKPYSFKREFGNDEVWICLGKLKGGAATIPVGENVADGTLFYDKYSMQSATSKAGKVTITTPFDIVLLEK